MAVFGGGMDAERKGQAVAGGNFLYMVDIETGKAIYKRRLDPDPNPDDNTTPRAAGSAPSDPAAVDTDQDGYLDTIYIGTTGGDLFKADISVPGELRDLGSLGLKVVDNTQIGAKWAPFPVFDTGGRPIYHPPAVVFVAQRGQFALAFGTGDREDLWSLDNQQGRLDMILDNNFVRADFENATPTLPRDDERLRAARQHRRGGHRVGVRPAAQRAVRLVHHPGSAGAGHHPDLRARRGHDLLVVPATRGGHRGWGDLPAARLEPRVLGQHHKRQRAAR